MERVLQAISISACTSLNAFTLHLHSIPKHHVKFEYKTDKIDDIHREGLR